MNCTWERGFGYKVTRFQEERLLMVTAAGRDRRARSAMRGLAAVCWALREAPEWGVLVGWVHGTCAIRR
jgi:hypothetical protein